MNTSNAAVTRLKKMLMLMESLQESMCHTKSEMRSEYDKLGIMYHGKLTEQLEIAVDRCCTAISATEKELVCCGEFFSHIIRIMEEYENIQFEDKLL